MKTTAYQIAVFAALSIAALGSQAQSINTTNKNYFLFVTVFTLMPSRLLRCIDLHGQFLVTHDNFSRT